MEQIPIEYCIYFQLGIDIGLILLILFFLRQLKKTLIQQSSQSSEPETIPSKILKPPIDTSALDVLKDLMESAKDSSKEFDRLIHEKKMLIAMFDEKLELKKREFTRIIKKGDSVAAELKRQISDAEYQKTGNATLPDESFKDGFVKNYSPPPVTPAEPESEKADQTESIMELSSRGLENHAIAARLNIPVGEVELILGLNRIIKSEQIR